MGVLDQIMQLKERGLSDEEIVRSLQERGISPREINDAIGQAQIKSAVYGEEEDTNNMRPSIMKQRTFEQQQDYYSDEQEPSQESIPPPSPSNNTNNFPNADNSQQYVPQTYSQEYSPSYAQQPTGEYYQDYTNSQTAYAPSEGISTDTIIDIADQVFSEKIANIKKQLDSYNEFKAIAQTKIESIDSRLRKIEAIIDKLQISILEKVGSYGEDLSSIKKEMTMIEDSFSKALPHLLSRHKKTESETKEPRQRHSKKARKNYVN